MFLASIPSKPGKPTWPNGSGIDVVAEVVIGPLPLLITGSTYFAPKRPSKPLYPPGSSGSWSGRALVDSLQIADRCAVDADADEVGERLRRGVPGLSPAASFASGEPTPKTDGMSMPVFSMIVFAIPTPPTSQPARVYGTHGAGAILPVLVDHLGREVGLRRGWERRSAGSKSGAVQYANETRSGSSRRREVAVGVRDGLAVAVRVEAGQRGEDPAAVCEIRTVWSLLSQRAVVLNEVQQVRHLLEVGRDVRVVPPEVDVVELELDDVLDAVGERAVPARAPGRSVGFLALANGSDSKYRERRETATASAARTILALPFMSPPLGCLPFAPDPR